MKSGDYMREVIDIEKLKHSREVIAAQIIYDPEVAKSKIREYTEMVMREEEKANKRIKIERFIAISIIALICFKFLCFISSKAMMIYFPELLLIRILLIFLFSAVFWAIYYIFSLIFLEIEDYVKALFTQECTKKPTDFYSSNEHFYNAFAGAERIIKIDLVRGNNGDYRGLDFNVANTDGVVKECSIELQKMKVLKQLDSNKIVIDFAQARILIPYK